MHADVAYTRSPPEFWHFLRLFKISLWRTKRLDIPSRWARHHKHILAGVMSCQNLLCRLSETEPWLSEHAEPPLCKCQSPWAGMKRKSQQCKSQAHSLWHNAQMAQTFRPIFRTAVYFSLPPVCSFRLVLKKIPEHNRKTLFLHLRLFLFLLTGTAGK